MRALKKALKGILALTLSAALLSVPAFAEEGEEPQGLIDGEQLNEMVEQYIQEKNLNPEKISVGYCYTATGDTWLYNGDRWYYSASMYKVPLMMILAEREHNGELTQESKLNGLSLAEAEESILVYSNNDYAHLMMHYIGTDRECRELYQQYSDLPVEDYDPDFYDFSYFNARFMTDVMKTLYFENERFPHIIDCLKLAQPGAYFRRDMGGEYEIAQKYGSYKEFNSTAGIVYTPNPYILVVMTRDMSIAGGENTIAELAVKFRDYTLQLDTELEAYEQAQAEAEAEALAEQLLREQEELERQQAQAEAQPEPSVIPSALPEAEKPESDGVSGLVIAAAVLAAAVIIAALALLLIKRRKKTATAAAAGDSRGYTPKH